MPLPRGGPASSVRDSRPSPECIILHWARDGTRYPGHIARSHRQPTADCRRSVLHAGTPAASLHPDRRSLHRPSAGEGARPRTGRPATEAHLRTSDSQACRANPALHRHRPVVAGGRIEALGSAPVRNVIGLFESCRLPALDGILCGIWSDIPSARLVKAHVGMSGPTDVVWARQYAA